MEEKDGVLEGGGGKRGCRGKGKKIKGMLSEIKEGVKEGRSVVKEGRRGLGGGGCWLLCLTLSVSYSYYFLSL